MREIARRFNERFGPTLVEPEHRIPGIGARIMDLQRPTVKMSTTGGSEAGTVYVLDEPDAVAKKFRSAVTDSGREIGRGEGKEGIENLIEILAVVRGVEPDAIESEFEGAGYGDFKGAVGEAVADYLAPVRERYAELRADEAGSSERWQRAPRRPGRSRRRPWPTCASAWGSQSRADLRAGTPLHSGMRGLISARPRAMQIPETRYTSSGGVAIAHQVHGAGEHDLLFAGTTASNVETVWQLPEAARFLELLGRFARVIRFDRRDTGISDPTEEDLTVESHAADALAVMDAVGSERPFLLGGIEACRPLAALAATNPDRVAGLIAICPSARGSAIASPRSPTRSPPRSPR